MKTFDGLAELADAVGTHLGHSDWHTVTQDQINLFADSTGDHQWIHLDAERAAGGPFGGTIAHGYLTLSLLPLLVSQVYRVDGLRMGINYGSNKVRFPAPVRSGSEVRAGVELVALTEATGGHMLTGRVTVERRHEDKPACVAEILSLLVV